MIRGREYRSYRRNKKEPRTATERIEYERCRQIQSEEWDSTHDDAYINGELKTAAGAYESSGSANPYLTTDAPASWPWDESWWKPKTAMKDLIRAGALLLAERDRLIRMGTPDDSRREIFDSVKRVTAKVNAILLSDFDAAIEKARADG